MSIAPANTHAAAFELADVELPLYELPIEQPVVPAATYEARVSAALAAATAAGLDALVVYGDREHFANIAYLTGFDPRWEEMLLLLVPGRTPVLLAGNESMAYAASIAIEAEVLRFAKFSLVGQPDPEQLSLADAFRLAGFSADTTLRVGTVGWKFWDAPGYENWIELPSFIVDELRSAGFELSNANTLFTGHGTGLRLINDVDQIAAFEFAGCHSSESLRRMIAGVTAGMTELQASVLYGATLLPFSYHPTLLSGERAGYGVASPSGRVLEIGDAMSAGFGHWGSNSARGGFLVSSPDELPPGAHDYVTALVAPYFAAAVAWYESMRIGVTAGEIYDVVHDVLDDPFYGVYLNPGHHIHLDEWPSSPVAAGSPVVFGSGMALQLDIIPATGTVYGSSNIEDGIVLADAELRSALAERYPDAWARIQQRRDFMASVGITLDESVLPMSNIAGWLPPFWLAPHLAMRRA
jgi:Xaa-Pro aminopeptidase